MCMTCTWSLLSSVPSILALASIALHATEFAFRRSPFFQPPPNNLCAHSNFCENGLAQLQTPVSLKMNHGSSSNDAQNPAGSGALPRTGAPLGVQFNEHKAGIDVSNLDRIQEIVQEAARGGRFFEEQERKEALLVSQVEQLRIKLAAAPASSPAADAVVSRVEAERGAGDRIFVCVDFDAFFSSVAALDDPSLVGKPHAIGGGKNGVLSTSSYEARKFGVRSAMPTFIAKKLCPDLILVPANYGRYEELSKLAMEQVFSKYGSFEMRSLDECIIDLTDHCLEKAGEMSVRDVVDGMRRDVTAVTGGLTCSAGCASTPTLAKICADINKPNGSFFLPNDRDSILSFCSGLKLRKVPFLGKVTERLLSDAFGITHVGGLLERRAQLHHCFSSRSYEFLVRSALGVQAVGDGGPDVRKSVSRERTFMPLKDSTKLREIVKNLCSMVCDDFRGLEGFNGGRCVTVKVKTSDFRVRSRSRKVKLSVGHDAASVEAVAMPLLEAELPFEGRLLGVRVSELVGPRIDAIAEEKLRAHDPNQSRIEKFFCGDSERRKRTEPEAGGVKSTAAQQAAVHAPGMEVLGARSSGLGGGCGENVNVVTGFHGDESDDGFFEFSIPPCPLSQSQPVCEPKKEAAVVSEASSLTNAELLCPICETASYKDLGALNQHIDLCLNAKAGLVPCTAASVPSSRHRKEKRRKTQTAMDSFVRRGPS